MWFVMTMMVMVCFVASVVYLINGSKNADIIAHQAAVVTLLFGACGYFTGLIWSKYTWYIGLDWGTVVSKLLIEDIKLAGALVAVLVYIVYLIVRESIEDKNKSFQGGGLLFNFWNGSFHVFSLRNSQTHRFHAPRKTEAILHSANMTWIVRCGCFFTQL
jgi:hypothetical protein